jgi:hypothetical protein
MPDVLVRNVDESVLAKLKDLANRNRRTVQGELLTLINNFVASATLSDEETAARIKDALRGRNFTDSAALMREDRNR